MSWLRHLQTITIGAVILVLSACTTTGCTSGHPETEQVRIGGQMWELEIAADDAAIQQGLMHRPTVPDGTGMLFIFDRPALHSFWMGHCLTDIDLIFIDVTGRIISLHEMKVEAPQAEGEPDWDYRQRMASYPSRLPAQLAIELPPGSITRLGLKAGQSLDLNMRRLRAMAR